MILKNKTIFILGISKFDGAIESTSFTTAKYLAQENDVYYIDFPYTLKDYFLEKDKKQFESRKKAFFSSHDCLLQSDSPRLKVLILPPLLSINFLPENFLYRFLLDFNERIIVNRVNRIITKFGIRDFVFINSFNFHYPNVGRKLKSNLLVYHCVDPLIVGYDKKHGLVSESLILRRSDLIICTSKQLYKEKVQLNKNTFFIPNAADIVHCSSALDDFLPTHASLKSIEKPVIGYFGNIERRIDFKLLLNVALMNPGKSFVFVGPVDDRYVPDNFKKLPNVFFLGKVSYSEMPAVLKGFDVSIIPFKKDEVSSTIFPLKLFEYLGAGRPVVSTDFNSDLLEHTKDTVMYCKSHEEFSNALDFSLKLILPEHRYNRLKVASENTWEKRMSELSALIFDFYERNNSDKKEWI